MLKRVIICDMLKGFALSLCDKLNPIIHIHMHINYICIKGIPPEFMLKFSPIMFLKRDFS